jgi:DNA-binding helix-hairpin-helix protein with protein kinase domain
LLDLLGKAMTYQLTKNIGTAGQVLGCVGYSQSVELTKLLATSGEGQVWHTDWPGYVAKLYYHPTRDRIRKLEVMIANPPTDPNSGINHNSFAWPKALLKDSTGQPVGFIMPEITTSVGLFDVYNPQRRRAVLPAFNWLYLHVTAMNIASITQAIHTKGYVLGDLKPQNILVNNQALPSMIDTDSFQVSDPTTGQVFRCLVGTEGFTPPELLGRDLAQFDQSEGNDRFRLGVIIHLLLFGDQPFKGIWTGWGEAPDPNMLLSQGHWPYGSNTMIKPGPLTIPLETVHPEIKQCFLRCFNEGHRHPELRPTAAEWLQALKLAVADLKACQRVNCHYYSQQYGRCYWCDRKKDLGIDIFSEAVLSRAQRQARKQAKVESLVQPFKQAINTSKSYLNEHQIVPSWPRLQTPELTLPKIPAIALTIPSVRIPNMPIVRVPDRWRKNAVMAGLLSTAIGVVFLVGKILMAQEDPESTAFSAILVMGLIVLWSQLAKSSD